MKWKKNAAMLSLVLSLGLTGCGIVDVVNNEVRADHELREEAIIYPASAKEVKKSSEVETTLANFELALQNDYLELYIGKQYDIAVYEKKTGKLTLSNPAFYDLDETTRNAFSDESKKLMYSQVMLEYYTRSQNKMSMASYPDAYSSDKDQVTWQVEGDVLTVSYGMGNSLSESPIIPVFTQETYEGYLEDLSKLREEGKVSVFAYRDFTNSYVKLTYENMKPDEQKRYLASYPKLEELGVIYVLNDRLTTQATNTILELYTMLGIDESVKDSESEKLGEVVSNRNPAFFKIPVCYRLSGGDLLVSVDLDDIVVENEDYTLTKVELLKCFGASSAEDEGYIFMPDGSGSIIENNIVSNAMDKVMVPFYGEDQAVTLIEGTHSAINNVFPVFGIKKGDQAVFAIVENGAAVGGMTAQIHSNYLNYNIAYPYFIYHVVDNFGIQGVSLEFYQNVADVDYTVRYHFLNGDEADYIGMAAYYQQYLAQTGALARQVESDTSWGLDIELLGSMKKTVNDFGIPIDVDYAVTTFEQAQEIMDILHENGISDVDVIYSGLVNGGMEQKALQKVKIEKGLGGLKGYQTLDSSLTSQGDTLYAGMNPMEIFERGNGIWGTEDVSKYLTKSSVLVGVVFNDPNRVRNFSSVAWLVNPQRWEKMTTGFLKGFEQVGSKKLYLESVGAYLNGNYSAKEGVTRQTAQRLTEKMLAQHTDAGYELKLDVGNDYVLPYVKSLVNVPTSSSHQRVESYSIPFVGMVLKGYIPFTCSSINQSPNADKAVLEAIESGAGLNYLLIYDNQLNLIDTNYEDLFSVNYKTQIEKILEDYKNLNSKIGHLQNARIVGHEHLTEDVNCVTYEDGTKIYINYGNESSKVPGGTVEPLSWLVVGR